VPQNHVKFFSIFLYHKKILKGSWINIQTRKCIACATGYVKSDYTGCVASCDLD